MKPNDSQNESTGLVVDAEEHIFANVRLSDFLSDSLTESEGRWLAEALIRGLTRRGRDEFTFTELKSVMDWGHAAKSQEAVALRITMRRQTR